MASSASIGKPYKGIGMEGPVARWYASLTAKSMDEFNALARSVADEAPRGSRILEVAPGPGYFSIEIAKLGYRVTGLDISRTFVDIAERNALRAGVSVDFRHGNAAALPFDGQSFDYILCRAAFKNFAEPVRAIEEMHRVLAPGGRARIIDLRRDASPEEVSSVVDAMPIGVVDAFITRLTFRFMLLKRAYTKAEIERFVSQAGFRTVNIIQSAAGMDILLEKS